MLSQKSSSPAHDGPSLHSATPQDWSLEHRAMRTTPPAVLSELLSTKVYTAVPQCLLAYLCADSALSDGSKTLWLYLFGECARWPNWTINRGIPALSRLFGVSARTIQRRLDELEECAMLVRTARYLDGRQLVNKIRITLPYDAAQLLLTRTPDRRRRRATQASASTGQATPRPHASAQPHRAPARHTPHHSASCTDKPDRVSRGPVPLSASADEARASRGPVTGLRVRADAQHTPPRGQRVDLSAIIEASRARFYRSCQRVTPARPWGQSVDEQPTNDGCDTGASDRTDTPNDNTQTIYPEKTTDSYASGDKPKGSSLPQEPASFLERLRRKPVQASAEFDIQQSSAEYKIARGLRKLGYYGAQHGQLLREVQFSLSHQNWRGGSAKAVNACLKLIRENRWRTPSGMYLSA